MMLGQVVDQIASRLSLIPGLRVQGIVPSAPPEAMPVAVVGLKRAAFPPPERLPQDVVVSIAVVAKSVLDLARVIDDLVRVLSAPWEASGRVRGVGQISVGEVAPLEGHATALYAEVAVEVYVV